MSETVTVALIAVLGTLGSGVLSYIASRRNTEVQLAAIEMDMAKLQVTQANETKGNRQRVYEDFVSSALELELQLRGIHGPFERDKYNTAIRVLGESFTRVALFGEDSVVVASRKLTLAIANYIELVASVKESAQKKSLSVDLTEGFEPWKTARDTLLTAMRRDLGSSVEGDMGPAQSS